MARVEGQETEVCQERKVSEETRGWEVRDPEGPPDLQVCQGRGGLAARDLLAGPAVQAPRVGRGAPAVLDLLDHQATATRTPAWATTLEFNRTIGMIIEEHPPTILLLLHLLLFLVHLYSSSPLFDPILGDNI